MSRTPIRLIVANDFEVVVKGVATLLAPYADRVEVVELDVNLPATQDADVVLYDAFGAPQGEAIDCKQILADCRATYLVVYTWNLDEALAEASLSTGVSGYLSKRLPAEALVEAIERVVQDQRVVSRETDLEPTDAAHGDWPGRAEGLSERESEVLAYIVQGLGNQELADRAYLSINTVKTYIRTAYRKMGVTSRTQAVLWGIDRGFRRDRTRLTPDGLDEL